MPRTFSLGRLITIGGHTLWSPIFKFVFCTLAIGSTGFFYLFAADQRGYTQPDIWRAPAKYQASSASPNAWGRLFIHALAVLFMQH